MQKKYEHENNPQEIHAALNSVDDIISESLVELRRLSKTLTDSNIGNNSIQNLINIELDKLRSLNHCKITRDIDDSISIKSNQTKTVLVRVIQEFIQNSLKHSECETINIALQAVGDKLELNLWDNGKGFDLNDDKVNGIGLKNIKKRVELIGGEYELKSESNKGTELEIKIPKE